MPCASRRDAVFAAVEAHNRTHPAAPLPRPAARLLAVMFATEDVCCLSQQALVAEGFGKTLPEVLRALVEAASCRGRRARHGPGYLPASGAGRSAMIRRRREKVFGPGRAVPLDRNAKARILAYARAWGARHRQPGQHKGPITRAFLEVLEALLWGFHNARSGCCFPSYEAIAARAECARSTVAEALKALEWAGVLTWQNRIARIHVRERDLFGRWASRWRVIRTSNAYVFRDPQQRPEGVPASKSENPTGNTESRGY